MSVEMDGGSNRKQFTEWLERFLTSKRAANRSDKTLESYAYHIHAYIEWLTEDEQSHLDFCEAETIEAFIVHEHQAGYSPYTVAGRYRSLRVWYNFLLRRVKCVTQSPLLDIPEPALPDDVRPYVTLGQFQRLMASIEAEPGPGGSPATWFDLRDRAMIYLIFWCGLRVSELVGLSLPDVDANRQQVVVRRGKGGAGRIVPCGHDLGPMLLAYLVKRPPTLDGLTIQGNPLFVSNNGAGGIRGPLTDNGVRQMLRRRCQAAGMTYLNPHSFRHGFAMLFLNNGMDLSAVSDVLGHASEELTRKVYAHWLPEGIRREYADVRRRVAADK